MTRLFEYQSKSILKGVGVKTPEGEVVESPEDAGKVASEIGCPVVVKAQIFATGRFKAGGIKFANTPEEAIKAADELLGSEIKGMEVKKVLVEKKVDIDKEYYVGIIVDDSYKVRSPVVILSSIGGVDIEEILQKHPDKMIKKAVDIFYGLRSYDVYNMAIKLGFSNELLSPLSQVVRKLYEVFRKYDCSHAEINPLVLTKQGEFVAVDCRISIDDSSVVLHPELGIRVARESFRPPTKLEEIAWKVEEQDYRGIFYFAQIRTGEEGLIGFHGIGGGGAMLAMDELTKHGLKIANYADTSGNPTASKVYRCAKIILSQPGIEGYFLAGCVMASQEQWHHAHGLVKAFREELKDKPGFPVLILIAGNKEKESIEILKKGLSDLPIQLEIYGRDYIYKLDYLAKRMKEMVEKYREMRRGKSA